MGKRTYERIWVKAAPASDPALRGKEVVRMPWNPSRRITSTPVEVDLTSDVVRMLGNGDIVRAEQPAEE